MGGAVTRTFLFWDLVGSTRAWESSSAMAIDAVASWNDAARRAVDHHRGTLFKLLGDGGAAAFESAGDAVDAAVDLQRAMRHAALGARIGIYSGEAEPVDGDWLGVPLNRCARLTALGHGGQVLVGGSTALLLGPGRWSLRDLGVHLLRDVEDPIVVYQVEADGLVGDFPPLRSEVRTVHLPAPRDRLIGRHDAVEAVTALVGERRLVTLTGVGGTGKTRLAIEVARAVSDRFEITTFVDLATVTTPDQVVAAAVTALDIAARGAPPSASRVTRHIAGRAALLVLDNAEHVLDEAASLAEALLDGCPSCRLIVTSREPLGVGGEAVWRIPSLEPETAAELFEDRLGRAAPHEVVVELCRQLDGIPLAIELAAARARTLGVDEVLANIADRFRLLGGGRRASGRQATLHATLLWSHQLLAEPEQALLRRLAVFTGGFTASAADQVCGPLDGAPVRLALAALVDKSLVTYDDVAHRHSLLETVRLFAEERLLEAGESDRFRERHVEWLQDLFHGREGADSTSLAGLEPELPNIRAALDWLLSVGRDADVIQLALWTRGLFWTAMLERELGALVEVAARRCDEPLGRCEQVMVEFSTNPADDPFGWVGRVVAVDPETSCALTRSARAFGALWLTTLDPARALAEAESLRALPGQLSPDTALTTRVVTCHALYRLGRVDEAEQVYLALRDDRSSLYHYGPMLGLASMQVMAGKLDDAERQLEEIADDPYFGVRLGKVGFHAVSCELAAAKGDVTAAAAALLHVELLCERELAGHVAAEHQWFEAAAQLASTLGRIEEAAVLTKAADATNWVETSPFVTWTVERRHQEDPRWQRALAAQPSLDDARRVARELARSL